jgi:elongation factor Ts
MMDCKNALTEAEGDLNAAVEILRLKGVKDAGKRATRTAGNGLVTAELDGNSAGVLVELNCETDFVARTDDFKALAHDIAMQIAAMSPKWATEADIPKSEVTRKKGELMAAAQADAKNAKKPVDVLDKIIDGQMKKYFAELTLTDQAYWKDDSKTIDQLIKEHIAKLGENIVVRQFKRIELGVSE